MRVLGRASMRILLHLAAFAAPFLFVPPRAHSAAWTHIPNFGQHPDPTKDGWVVFDSRRGRFIHHPGRYFREPSRYEEAGYIYPPGTFAIEPRAWSPWSDLPLTNDLPKLEGASAVYDSLSDCIFVFGGTMWSQWGETQ